MHRLDQAIPAEIKPGSEFWEKLEEVSGDPEVKNVLEIGSSCGLGSTKAFLHGMSYLRGDRLFCIESSQGRFNGLRETHPSDGVKCYNVCSISISQYMTEDNVIGFYYNHQTNTNQYTLAQILEWRQEELGYIKDRKIPESGIEFIKNENNIDFFDLVLIDGSAFTAEAELNLVYGARYIALDDTNDIKNFVNYERLKTDPGYRLYAENQNERNGYAIFKLRYI